MMHALYVWLWENDGVGNFTASAVLFVLGGRWVWKRHIAPVFQKVHELHQHHLGEPPDGA